MGFKILAFWVFVVLLTCCWLGIMREKDPYILAMYHTPLFPTAPSEFWGQGFGGFGFGALFVWLCVLWDLELGFFLIAGIGFEA